MVIRLPSQRASHIFFWLRGGSAIAMTSRMRLTIPVLDLLVLVAIAIVLHNAGTCQSNELNSLSLAKHSNFLKPNYKAFRNRKTQAWCDQDPGACSRFARGNSQGNWTCCLNRYCIDVASDSYHCGACRHACGFGLSCCGGTCVDLNNNNAHCGNCFSACRQEKCNYGICGYGYGYGYSKNNQP